MESRPAAMKKASRAGATPLCRGLPEEVVVWEILVRVPPKTLLRCRAVCRAWHDATSTSAFLQAHYGCQPCLPIVVSSKYRGALHEDILAFDHRAAGAHLQPVAQLDKSLCHEASCDGLLFLSKYSMAGASFFICNPVTRQHAALPQLSGFTFLGMYQHRPTGEYRLLLRRTISYKILCYIFVLGSNEPPRCIVGPKAAALVCLRGSALVRDSLHWYPVQYRTDSHRYRTASKVIIVFDTTSESFRQMRAPVVPDKVVPAKSHTFELDGALGIYCYNTASGTVDIWMLQNYEREVWRRKCRVRLPAVRIKEKFVCLNNNWSVSVHPVDGDVLLLVNHDGCVFYVDIDGKVVDDLHRDGQHVYASKFQLKQSLVQHTFFTALEGYDVNALPFI